MRLALISFVLYLPVSAAAQVHIKGNTPEEQQRLLDAVQSVPDCLKESSNPNLPDLVVETRPEDFGAFYSDRTVWFHPALVTDDGDKALSRNAFWQGLHTIGLSMLNDTRRVALHEIAHHAQDQGKWPVDEFLELAYRDKMKRVMENERFVELLKKGREIEESLQDLRTRAQAREAEMDRLDAEIEELETTLPITAGVLKDLRFQVMRELHQIYNEYFDRFSKELRPIKDELTQIYNDAGFPSRFHNDMHALNHGGDEYFAIAITMLVYDHDGFCTYFSPEEMRWIHENMGPCLRQINVRKAPCYEALGPCDNCGPATERIVHILEALQDRDPADCDNSGPQPERHNPDVFDN